jgi:FdrA protein
MTATDVLAVKVFPRLYRDSVTLMALASMAQQRDGVLRVGAVMATPANLAILTEAGMLPDGVRPAPDDLILSVRASDQAQAESALEAAEAGLTAHDSPNAQHAEPAAQTIHEGVALDTGATVATVSTPGTYAPIVVEQALHHGLHVFCFSDNVDVADEVRLKRTAVGLGLLLMGPDCGTAIVDGVPLGFANAVRPGPVAIVAASGTGAQEVSCLLDASGVGVSQIIGVGGRDLSEEVGGLMTMLALEKVATDPDVEVIVVVSKPPGPRVVEELLERMAALGRPSVACLLGLDDSDGPVLVRGTLEGGAAAAAALAGRTLTVPTDPVPNDASPPVQPRGQGILGLYTGGTLASEAKTLLGRAGLVAEILDLGDDQYTAGRPHPMIDPAARADHVARAGDRSEVGLLLVDLVLGFGASPDPGTPLADAVRMARQAAQRDGRDLVVIGSVCGTAADPQGIDEQRAILRAAGVHLFPSNAAAVRFAIALHQAAQPAPIDPEEKP